MVIPKPGILTSFPEKRTPFCSLRFIDLKTTPLQTRDRCPVVKIKFEFLPRDQFLIVATVKRGKGYSSHNYSSDGKFLFDKDHPLDLFFIKK